MDKKKTHLKRATALTMVITLVLCQGFVTGTPLTQVVSKLHRFVSGAENVLPTWQRGKLPQSAQLSAQGTVTLNGLSARNGATVLNGTGVKTGDDSAAILSFGTMGQVELTSASNFTLAVEETTLGGQLRAGSATIVAPAGVAVKILTADGPVVANGREATVLTVDVTTGKTRVESKGSTTNADGVIPSGEESSTATTATSSNSHVIGDSLMIGLIVGTVTAVSATLITLAVAGESKCFGVENGQVLSTAVPCPTPNPSVAPSPAPSGPPR